ncbi:MAG TPA: hypothetical protein PKU97_10825, partial [Kofleriaceae bacterium]|nr:hypothetical protein [Kofleriaceae bacterium]
MLLSPTWALGIGVISCLPLVEPYKPFPNLMLVVFLPLALLFLRTIQGLEARTTRQIAKAATAYGLAFGVMFLMYSGWFKWAAPGLLVTTLMILPWRTARRHCFYLFAITGAVFLVITWRHLGGLLLDPASKIADNYIYFDTKVEPMYFAMWRNDLPGMAGVGQWPPHGEVGGVGLFTILLIIGFGMAMALGHKTLLVACLVPMMLGAWLSRFWYAHLMWETKLVQLYPRTTPLILYCMIVLTGYALYWMFQRVPVSHPLRGRTGVLGAVCALAFLYCSTGSALSERYMPVSTDPPGPGWLTMNAYQANWASKPKRRQSEALPWVRRVAPTPIPALAPAALAPATAPGAAPAPAPAPTAATPPATTSAPTPSPTSPPSRP